MVMPEEFEFHYALRLEVEPLEEFENDKLMEFWSLKNHYHFPF